jgi:DNA-binding transcriptional ArsR family regulator
MAAPKTDPLSATFSALADPTRRAILVRLADGPATVQELAEPFRLSLPAVSKHLKVLRHAGLLSQSRDAQRRPCRLEPKPLEDVAEWAERFRANWEEAYQRLDALLARLQTQPDNLTSKPVHVSPDH